MGGSANLQGTKMASDCSKKKKNETPLSIAFWVSVLVLKTLYPKTLYPKDATQGSVFLVFGWCLVGGWF